MKTRRIALLPVLVLLAGFLSAAPESGSSFLFQVDAPGGRSYLLGSIHMLKKEHYPLNPAINKAFDECDILVVEADLSGEGMMALQAEILRKARYPEGETLKEHIPEDLYRRVTGLVKGLGMSMDYFNQLKPWYVALTLQALELVRMGYNPQHGVDMVYLNRAREREMPIRELEGAEYQIDMLTGFSSGEQLAFLKASVNETSRISESVDEVVKAWREGDRQAIHRLLNEMDTGDPEAVAVREKMLTRRNREMVEKIVPMIENGGGVFIVVGAAHLVGPRGILRELEEKGYSLTQL